uniref:Uncharacterized protein n=1 Tax=Physcomitrium patens TaxID=3218 RepID=A0A2K1KHY1_PHYPA|nr:hypothetical protein PHYPA_007053 [Physcomitrium patens]
MEGGREGGGDEHRPGSSLIPLLHCLLGEERGGGIASIPHPLHEHPLLAKQPCVIHEPKQDATSSGIFL